MHMTLPNILTLSRVAVIPVFVTLFFLENTTGQWVACGVFIVMAAMLIRHAGAAINADSRLTRPGMMAGFLAGILAILGNPKAVLFYMGVLPGFFDLRTVTWIDVALIIGASVLIPLTGNLIMAAFVGRVRAFVTTSGALRQINIGAGALLILVGLVLPFV